MTPICRACGRDQTAPTATLLRYMDVEALPDYLVEAGLCLSCLHEVNNCRESLPDYSDSVPLSPAALHAYLTKQIQHVAARVASGRPVVYCESVGGTWSEEVELPCRRWASTQREGRPVCHWCDLGFGKGQKAWFAGSRPQPRAFLIWARDGEELQARAQEIARGERVAA